MCAMGQTSLYACLHRNILNTITPSLKKKQKNKNASCMRGNCQLVSGRQSGCGLHNPLQPVETPCPPLLLMPQVWLAGIASSLSVAQHLDLMLASTVITCGDILNELQ